MSTIEGFEAWLRARGLEPKTIYDYAGHVRCGLKCGFRQRLVSRELAPMSVRAVYAAFRAWCRYVGNDRLAAELAEIRLPASERKTPRVPLPRDQWLRLLRALEVWEGFAQPPLSSRNVTRESSAARAALEIMARRGLRIGDVLRIRRVDIEWGLSNGVLPVLGKRRRRLEYGVDPIRRQLEELVALPRWGVVAELLAPRSSAMHRQASAAMRLRRLLQSIAKGIGVDKIYPHQLRRTVAFEFLRTGHDMADLQAWMGWRDIRVAAQYVDHARHAELDKAAQAMYES